MDSFVYSINATVPIFVVMILGGLIKKWNIIDDHFANKANKYVFHVALPCLLFLDIASADVRSQFDIRFVLFCMIVTTTSFAAIWGISELLIKDETVKGSFVQGSFRSSAAILGLAFIQNMYKTTGMAPLMIVSAVPLYNIYSVIVLTFKANHKTNDGKKNIQKAFVSICKNPIIIAIFLGLPFSILQVRFPVIVNKSISMVAQTATPIALLVIGAGFEGRKALKKMKLTVVGSFIKLILLTALFLPVAVKMGFRNQELMAILIMLGSPSTVSCYIMAKNMDNDAVLSSSIIVLTTMLSSVTLTAWIFVLRSMGLV